MEIFVSCENCGAKMRQGSSFCTVCGTATHHDQQGDDYETDDGDALKDAQYETQLAMKDKQIEELTAAIREQRHKNQLAIKDQKAEKPRAEGYVWNRGAGGSDTLNDVQYTNQLAQYETQLAMKDRQIVQCETQLAAKDQRIEGLYATVRETRERCEPLSVGGWIGTFFVLGIPVINVIVLLVWACGGTRNENRQKYAQAIILWVIIGAILVVLIAKMAPMLIWELFSSLWYFLW